MTVLADLSGPPPFVLAGCIVAAVVGTVLGLRQWRRRWLVVDTPTSKCAAVFAGRNEVIGHAETLSEVYAPVAGARCVWLRWEIEKWVSSNDGRGRWKTIDKERSRRPFLVTDDSGSVMVNPAGAEVMTRRVDRREPGSAGLMSIRQDLRHATSAIDGPAPEQLAAMRASQEPVDPHGWSGGTSDWGTTTFSATSGPTLLETAGRYRVTEWRIEPGDDLYVLGDALPRGDEGLQFATGPGRDPLLVAQGTQDAVADGAGTWAGLGMLAGLAGVMGIPAAVHALRTARPEGPVPGSPSLADAAQGAMLIAAGIFLALLGIVWLVRVFNRLVAVKEQAASAWSMIDVALRRRHDLLPALVEVTAGYAAHENEALDAAARARSPQPLAPPDKLPSDDAVAGASRLDRRERADARTLMSLAEAYPALDADHQFQMLRAGLVATEDRIADARSFYNDALTVLRDRRHTFPGLLLAWAVRVPSWEPFAVGSGDARAPEVATR